MGIVTLQDTEPPKGPPSPLWTQIKGALKQPELNVLF